jgi:hypothetical protein
MYLLHVLLCLFLTQISRGQTLSTSYIGTPTTSTPNTTTLSDDSVNFATISAWPALPACLKDQLQLYDGGVASWIGCNSNSCLCSDEKFAEAEGDLASDTLQECSYVSDMNSATSILSEYCKQKGFRNLKGATSLNTGGIGMHYSSRLKFHLSSPGKLFLKFPFWNWSADVPPAI